MAIGNDANLDILSEFNNDLEVDVFKAHEARDIHRFFRAITMSVTSRSKSQSPDNVASINFDENKGLDDDGDLDLHGLW